jgi:glycolate oxidase iron-sulfur subunit
MQTNFTDEQLQDPAIATANGILRKCVHCGFCTATCPTYVLLGDELDSPRGRIYMIKDMLEGGKPASPEVVKHVDRCLTCLACMTTCPSGVDYMHLVDEARVYIEKTHTRPWHDRLLRNALAFILPDPTRLRFGMQLSRFGKPFARLFKALPGMKPIGAMLELAPARLAKPSPLGQPGVYPANGERTGRVALLTGCAQGVLDPDINAATIRLLNRVGIEVVAPKEMGCCGALTLHMGRQDDALSRARRNVDAWATEMDGAGLDAIIINTSGCGTTVKDYGHMLRLDPAYAAKAARCAAISRDISEFLAGLDLPAPVNPTGQRVTYHSACSMQHGQKIRTEPKTLLSKAGFIVSDVPEGHICCGSAGTYNILQPDIAGRLRNRKIDNINKTSPQIIAAGNIGCMTQIASGTDIPVVHTIELLDWAYGGDKPTKLDRH